jgi:hypothetical protein
VMITKAALEEMRAREEAAGRRVEEKKGDFERLGLGEAAARETAAVDAAKRRIGALRMVRLHWRSTRWALRALSTPGQTDP